MLNRPEVGGSPIGTTGYCMGWPLESALTKAGVKHTLETYQAHHGWCVPDHTTYDKAATERHWQALESLYSANLNV